MHTTSWMRQLLAIAFVVCCVIFAAFPITAADDSTEAPIRVGYDTNGRYLYQDANGEFRGFTIEYLYEITKYTGWKYTFVPFTSWADAVQALRNGTIDVLPTMLKTPEREKEMLFSSEKMGEIYLAVIVPKENQNHVYGDFDFLKNGRVGVRRNTVDATTFFKWAQDNKIQYTPVVYDDQKDLLQALDSGDIDAAAMSYAGNAKRYRPIAEFAPQGMYFAVAPNRTDVVSALNKAMKQILIMNPEFVSQITKEYLSDGRNTQPIFSDSERAFIEQSDPIRVTLIRHAAPYSYVEGTDETFYGILPELYERISELTGMKFTFVPVDSQMEALETIKAHKADMMGRLVDNRFFAMKYNIRLTTPYAYISMVQITRKGETAIHKIGVQSSAQLDLILGAEPANSKYEFTVCANTEKCFEALANGQVDAIYCDSITALYLMNSYNSSNYQINILNDFPCNLTSGICYSKDPRLAAIIDKSIRYISSNGLDGLIAHDRMPKTLTFSAMMNRMPTKYLVGIVMGLTLIIIVMALAGLKLWRKRNIEKKMALIREKNHNIQANLHAVKQINEAKDDFFSHISHDMRTPLNGIIGFTNLALHADTPEQKNDYINKIKISSNLLLDLVSDTLQLSKLERGKFPLTWDVMDSIEFFSKVATPIQVISQVDHVHFNLDISRLEQAWIRIDRLNTQKIFLNILSNAVKFTPEGGTVSMVSETIAGTSGTYTVRTTITDTGIGISHEFLPRVFEPFSQEQRAGTTKIPGTGLGLSIVQQMVDLLGGRVTIESEPNQGTTVMVELPFAIVDNVDEARPSAPVVPSVGMEILAGKHVLLCEDNELNTEIAKTLMEAKGMIVTCASNGQEGVEAFKTSPLNSFDCIIMDIRMPVMDGYEATRQIRALDRADAKKIPILAMTADAYEEDVRHCLDEGMNAHIAKPIDPAALFTTLAQWLMRNN